MEDMVALSELPGFFREKRVFITGHTGFKGAWLAFILTSWGARVTGYALEPPTDPSLYQIAQVDAHIDNSIIADVRDYSRLIDVVNESSPDIVFHLAAQPLVLDGYRHPRITYETNVMGTVNILEAIRQNGHVKSFVNITTDKVYLNEEREGYGYREGDRLDGFDPYSNSKSCSDMLTHAYARCYFPSAQCAISTVRAGNVIGGGDFSENRIIPDCVRALRCGKPLLLRSPESIRPYQHVLEPLFAYLLIAKSQWENPSVAGRYNVGPGENDIITTRDLVELFAEMAGNGFAWKSTESDGDSPHEANLLMLDSSHIASVLGWHPIWNVKEAVRRTLEWTQAYYDGDDMCEVMKSQIHDYMTRN